MPDMTMSQAAEWTGLGRATIHKAIQSGRLSAEKVDGGTYRINPAELARVYPPATRRKIPESTADTAKLTAMAELMAAKDREIALHRAAAEKAEAVAADLRAERDKLLGMVEAAQLRLAHEPREAAPGAALQAAAPAPAPAMLPRARAWVRAQLGRL